MRPQVNSESISLNPDQPMSMETVQAHLSRYLPDYAIPSDCLTIEGMPLTSSCKVDRKTVESWLRGLVSRPLSHDNAEAQFDISPLDESEMTARSISSAVADMVASRDPEIGHQLREYDFVLYKSGVGSIQVMSLSTFICKTFGVKLAMEHFHNSSSTVRQLACLVDSEDGLTTDDFGDLDLSQEIETNIAELLESIAPKS